LSEYKIKYASLASTLSPSTHTPYSKFGTRAKELSLQLGGGGVGGNKPHCLSIRKKRFQADIGFPPHSVLSDLMKLIYRV
jgi:hypothetical protein